MPLNEIDKEKFDRGISLLPSESVNKQHHEKHKNQT